MTKHTSNTQNAVHLILHGQKLYKMCNKLNILLTSVFAFLDVALKMKTSKIHQYKRQNEMQK